jgi:predicted nucleotide-binding protein
MPTLNKLDRLTLADGLGLLKSAVSEEEAKARLSHVFIAKILSHEPTFALAYEGAEIDWNTGFVRILGMRDRFCPTFSRADFDCVFSKEIPNSEEIMGSKGDDSLSPKRHVSRRIVLAAADILKSLGHSGFDHFLIELGLSENEIVARPNSLTARANSLSNFAFQYPNIPTAEGKTIAEAMVDRALQIFRETGASNSTDAERRTFVAAADGDGLQVENVAIVRNVEVSQSGPPKGPESSPLASATSSTSSPPQAQRSSRKVFLVHGYDEAALQATARFLERVGLEVIVLREQPERGRTIIEKFEECASEVGFAVVLLTPDDVGGKVTAAQIASRARQNVIFELGYFVGKLGRGHACLLRKGSLEVPSDLYGVVYTEMDEGEGWKIRLAKELKAAKIDFDERKMFS